MACDTCHELSVRNEELEAEVAQLKATLYGKTWEPPRELHLTRSEIAMLQAMVAMGDRIATRQFLLDVRATVLGHCDEPLSKIIDVKLSHLRTKMKRFGLSIETHWGRGWNLPLETRHRLLNWQSQSVAA